MMMMMMMMMLIVLAAFLVCVLSQSTMPWMNKNLSPSDRATALLSEMTADEKIAMLHGTSDEADVAMLSNGYVGYVAGNDRLKIPALKLNDGPQGFRADEYPGTSTCWPSLMTVGMTWDRDLCREFGEKMAVEFYNKGANVLLGPGLNLQRIPKNGRNFEYLSGADPHLGYVLVQDVVKGIQSQKVIANAKHWIENNQETNRDTVSANVDERTRFELYYQPFVGAIEADVGSFMCSYNKINNDWSCENNVTLNHDLKSVLGYKSGWVMSDWGATHSNSIDKGLDMEMPGSVFLGAALTKSINSGELDISFVDESVMRILTPMFKVGLFDDVNDNTLDNDVTSESHNIFSRTLSASSQVLLKNENNILPLSKSAPKKIAIFGKAGIQPVIGGGGSGAVFPAYVISPFEGIANALSIPIPKMTQSCNSTVIKNAHIKQYGCQSSPGASFEDCSAQCAKLFNCNAFSYENGKCGFYPTKNELRPSKDGVVGECTRVVPSSNWQCNNAGVCIAYHDGVDLESATSLAKESDTNIVVISQFAKEGSDRDNLSFDIKLPTTTCQFVPPNQDTLVSTISSIDKPTIVTATAPGAVLMPWRDQVDAIIFAAMPGQEYGNALADTLLGVSNPSAKLTFTMPNKENEVGLSIFQYPGLFKEEEYFERSKIDYRWYTTNNVIPAYPFGHGLSYTTFEYSGLSIASSKVTVTVTNTGSVVGSEVVQLYAEFPELARTPPLQLKGFHKTRPLGPNETETIEFKLTRRDLSIWDMFSHSFKVVPGTYNIKIGSSSADLRLSGSMKMV